MGVERCGRQNVLKEIDLEQALQQFADINKLELAEGGGLAHDGVKMVCSGKQLAHNMLKLLTEDLDRLRMVEIPFMGMVRQDGDGDDAEEDGPLTKAQCRDLMVGEGATEVNLRNAAARKTWNRRWLVRNHPDRFPDKAHHFRDLHKPLKDCMVTLGADVS